MTTEVCDAFLSLLRLPFNVMQPAFGMAGVCTCMSYNNDYAASRAVHVAKAST